MSKTKIKRRRCWMLARRVSNGKSQLCCSECTDTLWRKLSFSYKVKYIPTKWPSGSFPRYLLKRNENIHPHKDLYVKENNFIHSHQKLETTHVHQQVNRWWNVVHSYTRALLSKTKERTTWSTKLNRSIS